VWDGDPLEPASAPVAVFLNGSEISLRTRQTLLATAIAPQARRGSPRPQADEMRGRARSILMSAAAIAAHGSNADESLPLQPARQISIDANEGTWLSPDISPDGGTIVFELLAICSP